MTARAGAIGLIIGLLISVVILIFTLIWPVEFLNGIPDLSAVHFWIADALLALIVFISAYRTVHREKPVHRWRGAALGGLAGGLAGMVVYCLWGAAAAGTSAGAGLAGIAVEVLNQTMFRFLWLILGGAGIGALGGWLAALGRGGEEIFDLNDPQMAMNTAITALPASIFTAALTAVFTYRITTWPLLTALLLALLSHLALMLVVPHETLQAAHRCGTDEVKMAAFVSIAAAPVMALLLLLIAPKSLRHPFVEIALALSLLMSLKSLRDLVKVVLPKRASFPAPDGSEKTQAVWFGSISESKAGRLLVLCTGCGLAMVLPLHVCLLAPVLNLVIGQDPLKLFLAQAGVSVGVCAAAVTALCLIYMLYLRLGKRFSAKSPAKG